MDNYNESIDIFEPPKKNKNLLSKFLIAIMAIALSGAFIGLGISAGYFVMQRFTTAPQAVETTQALGFHSVAQDTRVIAIDAQTPDFTPVIARVKDAVVSINVMAVQQGGGFMPSSEHHGAGSGFIFAKDDEYVFVATNYHVVANTNQITISLDDNERVPASIIGTEPDFDLAVLAVSLEALEEKGVPFILAELGCSDTMRMGDSVVAIGNAMGLGQTVTMGIISAVNLQITVQDQSARTQLTLNVLQTDAAVNQGNSGGPLINQDGEVIGIVTAKLFGHGIEGMGYVLPINDINELLIDLKETGSTRHAWLGIGSERVYEDVREMFNLPATGLLIRLVVEGSPAYYAGFMEWDLIVSVNSVAGGPEGIAGALIELRPGDEAIVGLYRNGEYMEKTVIMGSRPLS